MLRVVKEGVNHSVLNNRGGGRGGGVAKTCQRQRQGNETGKGERPLKRGQVREGERTQVGGEGAGNIIMVAD